MQTEKIVKDRYSAGAKSREVSLCCPVDYDKKYLEVIPSEVIEKDYGCGDPSKYLNSGETVLDLGSGTGKICFIASQIVGAEGKVIGVDMTEDMLEVARRNAPKVAKKIGYRNVEFRRGRIQDLKLDYDLLDVELRKSANSSLKGTSAFLEAQRIADNLRLSFPMIADNSVDVVISNCVLNLVAEADKKQLFQEIFRVLKRGGRAVISDIVADEEVPQRMKDNSELWSGCISGAFTELGFAKAFSEAGFYGVEFLKFEEKPWQTVEGIEFRSATIQAFKGKEGKCLERKQAVIYRGPFSQVADDDGHIYPRGVRIAVCDKTFNILQKSPYAQSFYYLVPRKEIPLAEAGEFDCRLDAMASKGFSVRTPKETKGSGYKESIGADQFCCEGEGLDVQKCC